MSRFERALRILGPHEGGYVVDRGGPTMRGVTKRTYDAYRKRKGLAVRDVRQITDAEVYEIYRGQYWDAVRAEELPEGVGYCVFDAAVNSGPGWAARTLQRVVGAKVDGIVGNETIQKAQAMPPSKLINEFCGRRLTYMKSLSNWARNKNGWSRRVEEVRVQSIEWSKGRDVTPSRVPPQEPADGPKSAAGTIKDTLSDKGAIGSIAGLLGSAGALVGGDGPVQYAIAAVLVLVALVGVWWLVKGRHSE